MRWDAQPSAFHRRSFRNISTIASAHTERRFEPKNVALAQKLFVCGNVWAPRLGIYGSPWFDYLLHARSLTQFILSPRAWKVAPRCKTRCQNRLSAAAYTPKSYFWIVWFSLSRPTSCRSGFLMYICRYWIQFDSVYASERKSRTFYIHRDSSVRANSIASCATIWINHECMTGSMAIYINARATDALFDSRAEKDKGLFSLINPWRKFLFPSKACKTNSL